MQNINSSTKQDAVCGFNNRDYKYWMMGFFVTALFLCIYIIIDVASQGDCDKKYANVNKNMACSEREYVIDKKEYTEVKTRMLDYLEEKKQTQKLDRISVFFRDLVNGPIMGIDEQANFIPASLMKLPIAIIYHSLSEQRPSIFNQYVTYESGDPGFIKSLSRDNNLVPGRTYSLTELNKIMLKYSDNTAYAILLDNLTKQTSEEYIRNMYLEMGLLSSKDSMDQILSVRRYASIFRGLYNISIVNKEASDEILSWMLESDYLAGLRAGVPYSVKISHKYGERTLPDGTKQLHDCGIVYFPNNPYVLCVMTEGRDYDDLSAVIKDISQMMYKEVESRKL